MDTLSDPLAALPLDPISPRLPLGEPFTPAMAARAGIGRSVLERLLREGRLRRLVRGVYVDATVASSVALRARALRLVVHGPQVVVGRTAAWLHGVEVLREDPEAPLPVEVHGRVRRFGPAVRLAGHDLQVVEGVRCTTALRTALDLGRQLGPDRALAALDGLVGLGAFTHTALMAELPRFGAQHGVVQLRELAALADARSASPAESVLRLRWLHARLPTPTPGLRIGRHRLALGLELHRFGATLAGQLLDGDLRALGDHGWRVVVLGPERVLRSDPSLLARQLEQEFHRHLLDAVG